MKTLARFVSLALVPAACLVAVGTPSYGAGTTSAMRLDPTFTATGSPEPGLVTTPIGDSAAIGRAVAVQPDGRTVVAGFANTGVTDCRGEDMGFAVARYLDYGSLDPSFGTGGHAVVPVGGSSDYPCPNQQPGTSRQVYAEASSVAVDSAGRVLVGGTAIDDYGYRAAIARLTPEGTLDSGFGSEGTATFANPPGLTVQSSEAVLDSVELPDGKLLLAGVAIGSDPTGQRQVGLVVLRRLLPNGSPDSSFGTDGVATTEVDPRAVTDYGGAIIDQRVGLATAPGGRILVTAPSVGDFEVLAFTAGGAPDPTFGTGGRAAAPAPGTLADYSYNATAADLVVQPSGKVVAVGRTNWLSQGDYLDHDFAAARFDTTGTLDPSFGKNGWAVTDDGSEGLDNILSAQQDSDGGIVVAGPASSGQSLGWGLTRYTADGAVDTTFTGGPGMLHPVLAGQSTGDIAKDLDIAPGGKPVLVGTWGTWGNTTPARFAVARFAPATPAASNGSIAFQRYMPDANTSVDVFTVDAFGNEQNLTQTPTSADGNDWNEELHPAWSPDGNRIAYFYAGKAGGSDSGIYTMDQWGSDRRLVLPFSESGWVDGIVWSPDGKHLLWERIGTSETAGLHLVRTDGTDDHVLTNGPAFTGLSIFADPAWSPDGTRIAFSAFRDDTKTRQVFTVGADGTGLVQVTHSELDSEGPAYSPDGSQLAFTRDHVLDCIACQDLFVSKVDGTDEKQILDTGEDDMHPSYSPDGSRLVFVKHVPSGAYTIYTVDPDGSDLQEVAPGQEPSWGPIPSGGSVDSDPPVVVDRSPAPGAHGVPVDRDVTVTFSEQVWVPDGAVFLKKGTKKVPASVTTDGSTVTLAPASKLRPGAKYAVTVTPQVTDLSGNPLAQQETWSFTTNAAPRITVVAPSAGSKTRDRTPSIQFSVKDDSSVSQNQVTVTVDGKSKSFDWQQGTGTLSPKLKRGTHTVSVTATDGGGASSTKTWSFSVA